MILPCEEKQAVHDAMATRTKVLDATSGAPLWIDRRSENRRAGDRRNMGRRATDRVGSPTLFLVKSEPSLAYRLPAVRKTGKQRSHGVSMEPACRKSVGKVLQMPASRVRRERWMGLLVAAGPLVWAGHTILSWISAL